jgi:hypothetical protein
MSLKQVFKDKNFGNVTTLAQDDKLEAESRETVLTIFKNVNEVIPKVDYSDPKNFAKFGSAKLYYSNFIENVYKNYPYDGSKKEQQDFYNNLNYFEKYLFDNEYPKTTGYITLSSNQYIAVRPAVKQNTDGRENPDSNIYDASTNRISSINLSKEDGNTVEFWFKQSDSSNSTYALFDLWNSSSVSDSNYHRMLIEVVTGSGFYLTYLSGASGLNQQFVDVNFSSLKQDWHHYAFTFKSNTNTNKIDIKVLVDANSDLSSAKNYYSTSSGTAITGNFSQNKLLANIGAYVSSSIGDGSGSVNGSIDEFKLWKEEKDTKWIQTYWSSPVGGGTNLEKDPINYDLDLYYKFNEGIISTGSTDSKDSIALDYSGRFTNGLIKNYTYLVRNSGSAIDESEFFDFDEAKEPIIIFSNPILREFITEKETLGRNHDSQNTSQFYYLLPNAIRNQDELADGHLKNITQILASYLDKLYLQIQFVNTLKENNYDSDEDKPLPFGKILLDSKSLEAPELLLDTEILEEVFSRNIERTYEEKLNNVKNLIYKNIYNNLTYIYKSKGTEKSFRNLFRSFGIDDEIVKLVAYANNTEIDFSKEKRNVASIKKNLVDFSLIDNHESSVYLDSVSGGAGVISQLSSIYGQYIPVTAECQVYFPNQVPKAQIGKWLLDNLSSSVFGFHSVENSNSNIWDTNDDFNFQVYFVRDSINSNGGRFLLKTDGFGLGETALTSAYYADVYDNTTWNLAVKVKPNIEDYSYLKINASASSYNLEFLGVQLVGETPLNAFIITQSLNSGDAQVALQKDKKLYLGAHRTNFTGSVLNKSDLKIINTKVWFNDLGVDDLVNHLKNFKTVGTKNITKKAFLGLFDNLNNLDTLSLNWDFINVTGSDGSGEFISKDIKYTNQNVNDISDITNKYYNAKGIYFPANSSQVVDTDLLTSYKQELPETLSLSDTTEIRRQDDIFFEKDSRPVEYFVSIENSMYASVSEEMLNMFSSIVDYNNIIGNPLNIYKKEYKELRYLRELFFQKVNNIPNLERYLNLFKWLDSSIGETIKQIVPATSQISNTISTIIESHILERNKYERKLPVFQHSQPVNDYPIKGINELTYKWQEGTPPINNDTESVGLWLKERAERADPFVTSNNAVVDARRQTILNVLNNQNNQKSYKLLDGSGTSYEASTYVLRKLSKPYNLSVTKPEQPTDTINVSLGIENRLLNTGSYETRPFLSGAEEARNLEYNISKPHNYEKGYQIFQSSGRTNNNKYLNDTANGYVIRTTKDVSSVFKDTDIPERTIQKNIFVERFSAPGGPETNPELMLNIDSAEYSAYNTVNYRNLLVRKNLNLWNAESSSINTTIPSYHKTVKNFNSGTFKDSYDNVFIQHQIPRSDSQYAWITSSLSASTSGLSGYFSDYLNLDFSRYFTFYTGSVSPVIEFCGTNLSVIKNYDSSSNTISLVNESSNLRTYLANLNGFYGFPSWKQVRGEQKPGQLKVRRSNKFIVGSGSYYEPVATYQKPTTITIGSEKISTSLLNDNTNFINHSIGESNLNSNQIFNKLNTETGYEELKKYFYEGIKTSVELVESIYPKKENISNTRLRGEYENSDKNLNTLVNLKFWNGNPLERAKDVNNSYNALDYLNTIITIPSASNILFSNITGTSTLTRSLVGENIQKAFSTWALDNFIIFSGSYYTIDEYANLFVSASLSSSVAGGKTGSYYNTEIYATGVVGDLAFPGHFEERKLTINIGSNEINLKSTPRIQFIFNPFSYTQYNEPFGLLSKTLEISGKKPWFDSYENYSEDLRLFGKNYSVMPEYSISDNIDFYLLNGIKTNKDFIKLKGVEFSSSALTSNVTGTLFSINQTLYPRTEKNYAVGYLRGEPEYFKNINDLAANFSIKDNSRLKEEYDLTNNIRYENFDNERYDVNPTSIFVNNTGSEKILETTITKMHSTLTTNFDLTCPNTVTSSFITSVWFKLSDDIVNKTSPVGLFSYLGADNSDGVCFGAILNTFGSTIKGTQVSSGDIAIYLSGNNALSFHQDDTTNNIENIIIFNLGKSPKKIEQGWNHLMVQYLKPESYDSGNLNFYTGSVRLAATLNGNPLLGRHLTSSGAGDYTVTLPRRVIGESADDIINKYTRMTKFIAGTVSGSNIYNSSSIGFKGEIDELSLWYGTAPGNLGRFAEELYSSGQPTNLNSFSRWAEELAGENNETYPILSLYGWYRLGYASLSTTEQTTLNTYNINFAKKYTDTDKLTSYLDGDTKITFYEKVKNETQATNEKIKLQVNGLTKLFPYNGFYPSQRAAQIGKLLVDGFANYDKLNYENNLINVRTLDNPNIQGGSSTVNDESITQAALQPFMAPGILFNSIKSGLAVDWTVFTESAPRGNTRPTFYKTGSGGINLATRDDFSRIVAPVNSSQVVRLPFETLINFNLLPKSSTSLQQSSYISFLNPTVYDITNTQGYSDSYPYFYWEGKINTATEKYLLAMNNYLAETPRFFLESKKLGIGSEQNSNLTTFISKKVSEFGSVISGTTYAMDLIIEKDSEFSMFNTPNSASNYFGPPVFSGSTPVATTFANNCYPYSPPYLNGQTTLRIKYTATSTGKPTLPEIISRMTVENIRTTSFPNALVGPMGLESCVNISGTIVDPSFNGQIAGDPSAEQNTRWIISTKWESPALNFNDNETKNIPLYKDFSFSSSFNSYDGRNASQTGRVEIKPTAGIGLWSGYSSDYKSGIKLSLRDTPSTAFASLAAVCGFNVKEDPKKIGQLATEKEISEAVVLVPYYEKQSYINLINQDTTEILKLQDIDDINREDRYEFIKLDEKLVERTYEEINRKNITSELYNSSIGDMLRKMNKYEIPLHLDFTRNLRGVSSISPVAPFAMYIFEFSETLDQQDLGDIWQGLLPKCGTKVSKHSISIEHKIGRGELIETIKDPQSIKWLVFKVKKKAEKFYSDLTDYQDKRTDLLKSVPQDVGYNWPYDYFSLVEMANVEVSFEFDKEKEE